MKRKIFTLFASLFIFLAAHATIHTITVSNFQFSPASINVSVGDSIKWVWDSNNGSVPHTTSSTTIPSTAATWDAPITSTKKSFLYKITVAGTYDYQCNIHPTSMIGVINATGGLAVTFGAFNIGVTSNNSALLTWKTLTESNTSYYSVRRSYDAKNFAEIDKVNAAGTSSVEKNYSYTDAAFSKASKYIYYEIAVINKDKSVQLSDIKMFQNKTASPKLITSLSPNPVTGGHLMLQFNADKAGEMDVKVFDNSGKTVLATKMTATEGLNNGHLMLMNAVPGNYKIVFELNGLKETHTVLVQ